MSMIAETANDLLYNLSRGFKGMSQGMVGGMAWGLSAPIIRGKKLEYGIGDVWNALLLSNVIGMAGAAIGDGLEFTADKFFPKPKAGLDLLQQQMKHPKVLISKHPKALAVILLSLLGVGGYHLLKKKEDEKNTNQ